jgi:hypothetical protein
LNNQPYHGRHLPQIAIDRDGVLAAITLGLARVHTCGQCRETIPFLIDNIARLAGEITRLHVMLAGERQATANLLAAIRAALGAESEGEADPFAYLRDELPDESGGAYGA